MVREPGLAGDDGGDAAALDAHAQAALVVEQELHLGGARTHRHHPPTTPVVLITGALRAMPSARAAVEGHRAIPGHAVGGDHLGEQGVEGQRGLDVRDLAQAVRLPQAVLLPLQLHLQRGHAAAQVLVLAIDVAQVHVAGPGGEHRAQARPHQALHGDSTAKTVWPEERAPAAPLHLLADEHEMGEHEPAQQEPAASWYRGRGLAASVEADLAEQVEVRQHLARFPSTTRASGSSATETGRPVSSRSSLSRFFSSEPPPVRMMPWSMMSAESSGGVRSRATRTAFDDGRDGLGQRLADLRVGDGERLGDALDEVAPLDLHGHRLVEREGGADLHLDLLGRALADEEVVLLS